MTIGRRGRCPGVVVAAVVVVAVLVTAGSVSAEPVPAAEDDFVGHIQDERASAGLAGYSAAVALVADLVAVARAHAEDMADQNRLHHNSRLPDQVEDWESLGENVGRGATVDDIHRAFMESPSHRAEILSTRSTQVGVGVVERDGVLWVVQVFRNPSKPAPAAGRSPTTTASPGAGTGAPAVTTTTTVPPADPLRASEAEIGGAPAAGTSAGGGGGGGARLNWPSGSMGRAVPREVTGPVAVATALLALMAAALTTQVVADQRTPRGPRVPLLGWR